MGHVAQVFVRVIKAGVGVVTAPFDWVAWNLFWKRVRITGGGQPTWVWAKEADLAAGNPDHGVLFVKIKNYNDDVQPFVLVCYLVTPNGTAIEVKRTDAMLASGELLRQHFGAVPMAITTEPVLGTWIARSVLTTEKWGIDTWEAKIKVA